MRLRPHVRGFTLIELMVVVAIVGVLAILGVVGYRKLINSSRTTEARQMVGGIRLAQEQYKAETGAYAPIHGKVRPADAAYCPNATWGVGMNTMKKMSWAPACGAIPFGTLPVHVDGEVMYGYATVAGVAADPVAQLPPVAELGTIGNWPAATSTDWYVVYAKGDTDNNGELGVVVGHSFGKELFVREE